MKQTLLVKLAPDAAQHDALLRTVEAFNDACNWIGGIAFDQGCANKIELQKLVYYEARARFGLAAQMAIRAISKVVEAYKRDTTVRPSFRRHGAMTYDERVLSFKGLDCVSILTVDGRVLVPMRIKEYFAARRDRIKGQSDLLYRNGTFYLAVTLDSPEPKPDEPEDNDFLGVDLGIVNLATDSDGKSYSGEDVELKRRVYAHRRRNLQRKGTLSAKRKLKWLRGRQARYQRNTNHIISKQVVQKAKGTGRGIALENLGGIRNRTTVKRKQRARHANWSFFQLRSFVAYKARLASVRVVLVDPRNSSRECEKCGHIDKANRPTQARFCCVLCGHAAAADHNAARIVRKRARAAVRPPNGGHLVVSKVSDAPTSLGVAPETSPQALAVGS